MSITAQEKELTLHDLIPGGKSYSRFVPRTLKQLNWCGDHYFYAKGDSVWGAKPEKNEQVLFTRSQLNEALQKAELPTVSQLPSFTVPYQDANSHILAFTQKRSLLHYDYRSLHHLEKFQIFDILCMLILFLICLLS